LHKNCIIGHNIEGKIEERRRREDDVNSDWISLREREGIGIWRRKTGELAVGEGVGLSQKD
jgi:hypothetical protein